MEQAVDRGKFMEKGGAAMLSELGKYYKEESRINKLNKLRVL